MKKWLKILVVYPVILLFVGIAVFLFLNQSLYYGLKAGVGVELQWYGFEERGNGMIEDALANINNPSAQMYRISSIQNTKNGNYDEAIKYLNRAAELDSNQVDGYFGWVLLYHFRDYDKALFHLNRLDASTNFVDYVSDDNILYSKGLCYKEKGNHLKALELFKAAIDYETQAHHEDWITHQMYFQTGRTLHLLDRQREAIEYYNKAITNWDGSAESIFYKGLAEIELGINSGCENLQLALNKLKKGQKSTHNYVRLFDEIYEGQVQAAIQEKCGK